MEPLRKANTFTNHDKLIKELARTQNISIEEATKQVNLASGVEMIWVNEKYQVSARKFEHKTFGPCMQINIRRRDGKVIFRDWREFQQIKNQLAGPEYEGIEIYPAESRKIDQTNKYHIWVILDDTVRVPFGWEERDVSEQVSDLRGMRQRPLPDTDPESHKYKGS